MGIERSTRNIEGKLKSAAKTRLRSGASDARSAGKVQIASQEQTPAKALDPDYMTSLARGLKVMQVFTRTSPRLTPSQISVATGFSRAAVRRCLHTLRLLGFVEVEETNQFSLSHRVLTLSHAYTSSSRLPRTAQPILERLSGLLHESCSVATLVDDELLYVARAHVSRIMKVDLAIGSRLPAYCTSMGRVLLAHLPPSQLDRYFRQVTPQKHTSRTITSEMKLRKVLNGVRIRGFAVVDQELEEGLRSVAVPVRGAGGAVVAALNTGAQAIRMPLEEIENRLLQHLLAAAANLSKALL
jgi:IclR family transcriptional regulator, pca regulon regulatory protein